MEQLAIDFEQLLSKIFASGQIKITGSFARQNETVDELEFVVAFPEKIILEKMNSIAEFHFLENNDDYCSFRYNDGIKVKLYTANETNFIKRVFETTNTSSFNESFYEEFSLPENSKSDEEIFKNMG
ncbi:MAG: hypothetical protein ACRDE8_03225, partial [Ginsengibacter sp.]